MSGKKNLLNEAQVRKFMKLARLEPLTNRFLDETSYREEDELDELRTGRTGALGPKAGRANPGHGRGQGETRRGEARRGVCLSKSHWDGFCQLSIRTQILGRRY